MDNKPKTITPVSIAPSLDPKIRDLILLLRTLKSGILEATLFEGLPAYFEIRFPDCVNRQPMFTGPLNHDEENIVKTVKFIKHGRLVVNVTEQGRYQILSDSVQKFKAGAIDWDEWI